MLTKGQTDFLRLQFYYMYRLELQIIDWKQVFLKPTQTECNKFNLSSRYCLVEIALKDTAAVIALVFRAMLLFVISSTNKKELAYLINYLQTDIHYDLRTNKHMD